MLPIKGRGFINQGSGLVIMKSSAGYNLDLSRNAHACTCQPISTVIRALSTLLGFKPLPRFNLDSRVCPCDLYDDERPLPLPDPLYRATLGWYPPILENQMDKKMENEMDTGIIMGYIGAI